MENHFNLLIGIRAGQSLTTGHHNIYLGDDAGVDAPVDESYMLRIGKNFSKQLSPNQFNNLFEALKFALGENVEQWDRKEPKE